MSCERSPVRVTTTTGSRDWSATGRAPPSEREKVSDEEDTKNNEIQVWF